MKKKRQVVPVITALMLSSILLAGCGEKTGEVKDDISLIESTTDNPQLVEVTWGDVEKMKLYEGEINPYMEILQFPQDGTFEEYHVTLGQQVVKGQVIATTEEKYAERIKQQKKDIARLETEYGNQVNNFTLQIQTNDWRVGQRREWIENMDSEIPGFDEICIDFELMISKGEKIKVEKRQYMERTEKEIEYQKECLAGLEEKEEQNVITAPCSGTVTYLAALKIGDTVNSRSYPVAIADLETPYIQCEYVVPQEIEEMDRIYAVKNGKEYELTYHPYEERELQKKSAKGEGIYSFFEIQDAGADMAFGDMAAVVMVEEQRKNVLVIPTLCIKRDGERCFVYKQTDGEKTSVDVQIGLSDKINTEILSGLEKGDMVYASN